MEQQQTTVESSTMYCEVHPNVETSLRCNKCGRPMCMRCAVRTPVGYRCKECVRGQQRVYYNAQPLDPLIQGAIGLVLGGLAFLLAALVGVELGFIGWLIAFWVGSAVGAGIADVAHRAVGRRRNRYSWLVVAGAIAASGLVVIVISGISITKLIFLVMAVVGAGGRLRL